MKHAYLDILNNYNLKKDDSVVAAISGGPDSMALLSILIEASKQIGFKIICAHVNHNLRIESETEKIMVEEYCKNNNVVFEYMKIEDYNKDNFHNDARKKRYCFFEQLINKYQAKYLFTAHHGDDLAETILMRISRGSTIQGYAGFSRISKKNNYFIARPLIELSKDELLKYVQKKNIPYAIDYSNNKDVYTRNRIRKYVIPELKKENNKFLEKINQFNETLLLYSDYIDEVVNDKLKTICSENKLFINSFIKEKKIIQLNILQKWLGSYYKEKIVLISNHHVMDLYNLINSKKPNIKIDLPDNIVACREYDKISLLKSDKQKNNFDYTFNKHIELPNGKMIDEVTEFTRNSNYICLLNSNEVKLPLHIRNKKDGDKMYIKGLNGKKKISDIFINEKISIEDRKSWPIVTDSDGQIIWLPGLKKSKFDKQKEENYDIILKYH